MRFSPPAARPRPRISSRWLLIAAALVLGVLFVSFLPLQDKLELHTKGDLHYPGHMLAFGGVAVLLGLAARSHLLRTLATVFALGFGFAVEFAQHVFNREAMEWTDVLVDSFAVLIGALLVYLFFPKPRR